MLPMDLMLIVCIKKKSNIMFWLTFNHLIQNNVIII